ncbi:MULTISPECIES: helix-turn-helix domain-containing protein [Micromonospora]|uniref:Helix-turn-helix transcriptional regulator n=1 Tax=Micromonospora antibiotica TaxID=2807623 RepID=A0ABS3V5W0_9ACTN|nr:MULTISPECIES: AraC family transcriptional regulator [Micromonospora]MBO4160966.1 helix-turn-helix transcriptional regulator [Micromonospora antibiotica]MBW4701508.1 helix-turn-helix transcriptional regulator [Micromonospora sp. RL09-050-HVF-A]
MEDVIERAVERAIVTMRDNIAEPLTIDDMARAAMFSKFHFSRIFRRVTGVSPGRFLSAIRLQEAKHLLVSTTLNVADISLRVGYNSVGTFSSRFTRSVGMSPTAYRRYRGFSTRIPQDETRGGSAGRTSTVRGTVTGPDDEDLGFVFVGLFPDPLPEGRPVRCAVLNGAGAFELETVPEGHWYLLVQSVRTDGSPTDAHDLDPEDIFVGSHGPIIVRRDQAVPPIEMGLKPARSIDPPVLLALLDIRRMALDQVGYRVEAA